MRGSGAASDNFLHLRSRERVCVRDGARDLDGFGLVRGGQPRSS